jgi:hypothetical protein
MEPLLVPDILYYAGKMYNDAFILIETKSTGGQIADELYYNREYWNVLGAKSNGRSGQTLTNYSKNAKGLNTSKITKTVGCTNLKMIIEHEQIIINDFDIVEELSNFALNQNTYKADEGFNDDLVSCLVSFSWATTQTFFQNLSSINVQDILTEKTNEMMESFLPMFMSDGIPGSDRSLDDDGWDHYFNN